jgi:hypothetical protein
MAGEDEMKSSLAVNLQFICERVESNARAMEQLRSASLETLTLGTLHRSWPENHPSIIGGSDRGSRPRATSSRVTGAIVRVNARGSFRTFRFQFVAHGPRKTLKNAH